MTGNSNENQSIEPNAYMLFLILLLLILGNQNTFDNYFELLNKQTTTIMDVIKVFSSTADGLQNLFQKNQGLKGDLF